ncbi:branched chain amino acid aminotransferase, partial [Pseudomonas brassicacearum]|nr:branched chain amino acid aminotransferase [Pseudomonas brassicacearum]
MELAASRLGLKVIEGDVEIDKLDRFVEAGACGGIEYNGKLHVFHDLEKVGPVTQKLYNELTGIQRRQRQR